MRRAIVFGTVCARAVVLLALILGGMITAVFFRVRLGRRWFLARSGEKIIQAWMKRTARTLGLRVTVVGEPVPGPVLTVANHVSWLDIVALNSVRPMSFLSKDNVRKWPLIGRLSAVTGTLFLRRGSLLGLNRTMDEIVDRLHQGKHVTLFPEGTTTDGSRVLPFHRALFRSAHRAQVPVQPVAIRYVRNGGRDHAAPFVGDDGFVTHLLRILAVGTTEVRLYFCRPVTESTGDSRTLARYVHDQVATVVSLPIGSAALAVHGYGQRPVQPTEPGTEPIFRSGS
jgi:1-acyl-sn-glycerol-3-phosphate acyltransferase